MKIKTLTVMAGALFMGGLFLSQQTMSAQNHSDRLVRLAELTIDPAQLEAYKTALRDEIDASIRLEPGVLALYAVTVKDHPNEIRLFEIYASPVAYQSHLQSEHFRKYKSTTASMVKSLRLIETDPLLLGAK